MTKKIEECECVSDDCEGSNKFAGESARLLQCKSEQTPVHSKSSRPKKQQNKFFSAPVLIHPKEENMEDVWTAAVKAHNQYRRNHGVPDVMGDVSMHQEAQKHAEHLAKTNTFELSKTSKYIGNLASSFRLNEEDAVTEACKRWYSTVQNYHWNNPGFQPESGSFTAMVWKNVTHIGVGIAWNETAASYVIVVYYAPSPNVCQEFRENVLRPVRIHL